MSRSKKEIRVLQVILNLVILFFLIFAGSQAVYAQPALTTVEVHQTDGDNNAINNCQDVVFRVSITNTGTESATSVNIVNSMPSAFTFVSVSPAATGQTVPADSTPYNWDFTYTATCDAVSGDNTATISYTDASSNTYTDILRLRPYTVNPGAIKLTKVATHVNGGAIEATSEPKAKIGETVTWRIRVESSGLGRVENVIVKEALGTGLSLHASTPVTPINNPDYPATDSTYQYLFNSTIYPGLASIDNGGQVDITVITSVDACSDLTNSAYASWGCNAADPTDMCLEPVTAQSSVDLQIKTPLLEFNPGDVDFPVAYCSSAVIVEGITLPITNNGDGDATNVSMKVNYTDPPFTISNITPVGVTFNTATSSFENISNIAASATETVTYDLTYTPSGDLCSGGQSGSGSFTWEPVYYDACNIQFYPPLESSAYTITPSSSKPAVTVTKSCSFGTILNIRETPTAVTCDVTIDYDGTASCGSGADDLTVTDTYPAEWTLDSVTGDSAPAGPYGNPVSWTIPGGTITDGEVFVYTMNFTVPALGSGSIDNSCQQIRSNSVRVTGDDCCNCEIDEDVSVPTYIDCEVGIGSCRVDSVRTIPSASEVCNDAMTFSNTYTFNGTDWDTTTWAAANIVFTEQKENSLALDSGPSITVNSASAGACTLTQGVDYNVADTAPPGNLVIDFTGNGGCPANVENGTELVIAYDLIATTDSSPECGDVYEFVDYTILDTACPGIAGEAHDAEVITNEGSSMSVSISGMPSIVSPCGEYTPRITITKTSAEEAYDVVLFLSEANYQILTVDGVGGDVAPDNGTNGDSVTGGRVWNYADLFSSTSAGQTATIDLTIQGACITDSALNAELYYNDACNDGDPSYTAYSTGRDCDGTSSAGGIIRDPSLTITKFPEVVYADAVFDQTGYTPAVWTITVFNSGAGSAYNVEVVETLGSDLSYLEGGGSGADLSFEWDDKTGVNRSVISPQEVRYTIDELTPGEKRVLTFTADIIGCEFTTNNVTAEVACQAQSACTSGSDSSEVKFPPTDLVVTTSFENPGDLCSAKYVTITARNAGLTPIRDIILSQVIPDDLEYLSNTSEYRLYTEDSSSWEWTGWLGGGSTEPAGSGTNADPYLWSYNSATHTLPSALQQNTAPYGRLSILNPEEIVEIRFEAYVRCDFEEGDLKFSAEYEECGGTGRESTSESLFSIIPNKPILTVTKTLASLEITCNTTIDWILTVTNAATGTAGYPISADYIVMKDTWGTGFGTVSIIDDSTSNPVTDLNLDVDPNSMEWELFDLAAGASKSFSMSAKFDEIDDCTGTLDNVLIARSGCYDSSIPAVDCYICEETDNDPDIPECPRTTATATNEAPTLAISLQTPTLNACDENQQVEIRLTNSSTYAVISDLDLDIQIPGTGVTYAGTPTVTDPDGNTSTVTPDTSTPGHIIFYDTDFLNNNLPDIPVSGGSQNNYITIKFLVNADCNASGDFTATPQFRNCCQDNVTPATATLTTTWQSPNLRVVKTHQNSVSGNPFECGDTVNWTIKVYNDGPITAEMVRLTDTYGAGLVFDGNPATAAVPAQTNTFFEASPPAPVPPNTSILWNEAGRTIEWEIDSLPGTSSSPCLDGQSCARTYYMTTTVDAGNCADPADRLNTVNAVWHCATGNSADEDPSTNESECTSGNLNGSDDEPVDVTPTASANASATPTEIPLCALNTHIDINIAIPSDSNTLYNLDATINLPAGVSFHDTTDTGPDPDYSISVTSGSAVNLATGPEPNNSDTIIQNFDNGNGHLADSVAPNTIITIRLNVSSSCFAGGDIVMNLSFEDCCGNTYTPSSNTTITASDPALNVTMTRNPTTQVDCGNTIDYTIKVENTGAAIAAYTIVEAQLGEWFTYHDAIAPIFADIDAPYNATPYSQETSGDDPPTNNPPECYTGTFPGICNDCVIDTSTGTVRWEIKDLSPDTAADGGTDGGSWTTTLTVNFNQPGTFDCDAADRQISTTAWYACPTDITNWTFNSDACSDEDNNNCTGTVTTPVTDTNNSPDLIITAINPSISCTSDGTFSDTLTVTVQNQGTGAAGTFNVYLEDGDGWSDTISVGSLAAGASTNVSFPSWNPDCNSCNAYVFNATVDSTNTVCECDESNNSPTQVNYTASIPDLEIGTITPNCDGDGRTRVDVQVINSGCVAINTDFNITVKDDDGHTRTALFTTVGGTLPLNTGVVNAQTVSFRESNSTTHLATDCDPLTVNITATLDDDGSGNGLICECNDGGANNEATVSYTRPPWIQINSQNLAVTCSNDGEYQVAGTVTVINNGGSAAVDPNFELRIRLWDGNTYPTCSSSWGSDYFDSWDVENLNLNVASGATQVFNIPARTITGSACNAACDIGVRVQARGICDCSSGSTSSCEMINVAIPDLEVGTITPNANCSSDSPSASNIQVTINNTGCGEVPLGTVFQVKLEETTGSNYNRIDTFANLGGTLPIPAGGSVTVTFDDWDPCTGSMCPPLTGYDFRVTIDEGNAVCECDGTNNTGTLDDQTGLIFPDFEITAVTPNMECDGTATADVTVLNNGCATASAGIPVQITGDIPATVSGSTTISLDKGASETITISLGNLLCDTLYDITAAVDPANATCECDGTNNTNSPTDFTIGCPTCSIINLPAGLCETSSVNLSANITQGENPGPYTYAWSDDCGGSFNDAASATPTWTAPDVPDNSSANCSVSVNVTDNGNCINSCQSPVTVSECTAIGDYVWLDANQDGLQDIEEYGISDVTVELFDSGNNSMGTTITNATGYYIFDTDLLPGDYYVEFSLPAGYSVTDQDQGDDTLDSDVDQTTRRTIVTTLTSGETDTTWDAGLYIQPASLGNYVWLDANQDGIQDTDEYGVSGVTVELYESGGTLLRTTTTDVFGIYTFTNLPPGDYYVDVTPLDGYTITNQDQGGDALDSDIDTGTGQTITTTLTSGENDLTWDAGLYIQPASIGNYVWLDANQDGLQDTGEYGISNVTVGLYDRATDTLLRTTTTNSDGIYTFTNLPPDEYYIGVTKPSDDYEVTGQNQGVDTLDSDIDQTTWLTDPTDLAENENDTTWDAGLYTDPASIGNYIWLDADKDGIQDTDEYGIKAVTVDLYDDGNNLIDSTTTDDNGAYSFTNLPPGKYYIDVALPASYTITDQNEGTDDAADSDIDATGKTAVTELISDEDDPTWDGGLYILPASIGNYVWLDADQDGEQDTDEYGISAVTVELYTDGNTLIGTTETDAAGVYSFTNLPPGDYHVDVTPPSGYTVTLRDQGGDDTLDSDIDASGLTIDTNLISDENDPTWDAGLYIQPASIGNYVWLDADQDGVQDTDEYGIRDVTVRLYDSGDNLIDTAITDDNGLYSFTNLPPNDYYVDVTPPAGYTVTGQDMGSDDALDSDIDTGTGQSITTNLIAGEDDPTWDAGLYIRPASIGDYVWLDASQDGIQDTDEYGINSVTVELYTSGNTLIETTTTNAYGIYSFTNLPPGDYYVDVTPPDSYTIAQQDQGSDDTLDSDIDTNGQTTGINLISGENDLTWDAGLYIQPASIGNYVWLDNADNVQGTDEDGVENVTVELYDSGNNLLRTATTNASGIYSFTNLPPADYYIKVYPPVGYLVVEQNQGGDDALDSDIDPDPASSTYGQSVQTTLTSGESDLTWDAGLLMGSLGNYVWIDTNGDGVQAFHEIGINNVTVSLYIDTDGDGIAEPDGDDGSALRTTTTDDDDDGNPGYYLFRGLPPNNYFLVFETPTGYVVTKQDQRTDKEDSDVNIVTRQTIVTTLAAGEEDLTWDMGITAPASLGDFVWLDVNGNGIQDDGNTGINDVAVKLYTPGADGQIGGDDDILTRTATTANHPSTGQPGYYTFSGLTPDNYFVDFDLDSAVLSSYAVIQPDQGGDDTADSDADTGSGQTIVTVLSPGENDISWDMGMYQSTSIGDYVWEDTNGNGAQDDGNTGINDVTVRLYTPGADGQPGGGDDTLVSTTITASMPTTPGYYLFDNLVPGNYFVSFDLGSAALNGYVVTSRDGGSNDTADSDADTGNGQTVVTFIESGESDRTWDMGVYRPASLGDLVWLDSNGNSVKDSSENGISGVTVKLYNSSGTFISSTTTNSDGNYGFGNLVPGNYFVEFTAPSGYRFSGKDQGSDDTDSDADTGTGRTDVTTLVSGENDPSWDAGIFQPVSIGDTVWLDLNANGIQEDGEDGVANITVELYNPSDSLLFTTQTDSTGKYAFTDLTPDNYYIKFYLPGGYIFSPMDQLVSNDSSDSDADPGTGQTSVTTLVSGENDITWDAGIHQTTGIGDLVWNDLNANGIKESGENGISGVTVKLYNGSGTQVGTTVTNGNGNYSFTNLTPGTYYVEFIPPAGYTFSQKDQGSDDTTDSDADTGTGRTVTTVLDSGEYDSSWDAGLYQLASIGDTVWNDLNNNGVQNNDENGVPDVNVKLYKSSDTEVGSTVTDADGNYLFSSLMPGDYHLHFDLPSGYIFTSKDQGSNDASDSDADTGTGDTEVTTLVSGENDLTWDAGIFQTTAIGDYVWKDFDLNGIQDSDENGINGIPVLLYADKDNDGVAEPGDDDGTALHTTATSDDDAGNAGYYSFSDLTPGNYFVVFTLPTGYSFTQQDQGGDDTADSDADESSGRTIVTVMSAWENDISWDAGLYQTDDLAGIGNYVWHDTDADGVQGSGESGINGVTVSLYSDADGDGIAEPEGDDGNSLNTTVTANDPGDNPGYYVFMGLAPGNYFVVFTSPEDYSFTQQDQGGDDASDSDAEPATGKASVTELTSGENDLSWDAGVNQSASIGNYVWNDEDRDGIQDSEESGINGVTVFLYEDRDEDDSAEPGGDDGAPVNTTMTTNDTSDNPGYYSFTNLSPGKYFVVFDILAGNSLTQQDQGGNDEVDSDADPETGQTSVTLLSSGENDITWDAGFSGSASIGNYVWYDADSDGIQDDSETGINGLTVNLYIDIDGDGIAEPGADDLTAFQTTTTSYDSAGKAGYYSFRNLNPGGYFVAFTGPADYAFTQQDHGTDDAVDSDADPATGYTVVTALTAGEDDVTWDAGLYPAAGIGNYVWYDADSDGIQDADESGINSVLVSLYMDADGDGVAEPDGDDGASVSLTLTATNEGYPGYYNFTGLSAGSYFLVFTKPAGYMYTPWDQDGDDSADSDVNSVYGRTPVTVLSIGENDLTWDAGLYSAASLGNYVWNDEDTDGIQDISETGMNGVAVSLYKDADGDGIAEPNEDDGVSLGSTVTADNDDGNPGYYSFTDLPVGSYFVVFTPPSDYVPTIQDQDADDSIDSDTDNVSGQTQVTSLSAGENDLTWDAGYYRPASIGDYVWSDVNADGIQESDENGINNVTVMLYRDADGDGIAEPDSDDGGYAAITQTGDDSAGDPGYYSFTDLIPGSYFMVFIKPAGYSFTQQDQGSDDGVDSDVDPDLSRTSVTVVEAWENDLTWDAGLYEKCSIGNFVWHDTYQDGVQEDEESGISGVTVKLINPDTDEVLLTKVTDDSGYYEFINLTPGDYAVEFELPEGYSFTDQDQGVDDAGDSDADTTTGRTEAVTLLAGEKDLTVDAGMITPSLADLGDFVWYDADQDGIQGSGESGISGVTVKLINPATGAVLRTSATDGSGYYGFGSLVPGDYAVEFELLSGYSFTGQNQGSDDAADSDADTSTGRTDTVTLSAGENNLTVDAGMYSPTVPASLGDFVWLDTDENGIQDTGEPGISDVTVNLRDAATDKVVSTTVTDSSGYYGFAGLSPDDYVVEFELPEEYSFTGQDQGTDDSEDSDADTTTGRTGTVTLSAGENNLTVDAGMITPPLAALGDFVWYDADQDGIQGSGESGISGVTVKLINPATGAVLRTSATDGSGYYGFGSLVP
ncbi:MAG: hypothetical protein GY799_11020, partial [Desulfobulbaceae bacterium]|nr:hypothetical protein [Desulfobulbaceae bacterium]